MTRERADSFISRFLFRSSKEGEQEALGADTETTPAIDNATDNKLVWATNGKQSVQKLVEHTLNEWLSLQIVWVHGMFVSNQRDK